MARQRSQQGNGPRIDPARLDTLPEPLRPNEPLDVAVPTDPLAAMTSAANLYLKAHGTGREHVVAKTEDSVLVDFAVEVWRLEKRLARAQDELDAKSRRALDASVNKLRNVLAKAKTEWRDPTGDAYSDGMRSVRALVFEPAPDLAPGERRIIETVRPAVLIDGHVAATGEVVVGTGEEHAADD